MKSHDVTECCINECRQLITCRQHSEQKLQGNCSHLWEQDWGTWKVQEHHWWPVQRECTDRCTTNISLTSHHAARTPTSVVVNFQFCRYFQSAMDQYAAFGWQCNMGIDDSADFVPLSVLALAQSISSLPLLHSHSVLVSAELHQDRWHERICCGPRQQQGLHSLGVKGQDEWWWTRWHFPLWPQHAHFWQLRSCWDCGWLQTASTKWESQVHEEGSWKGRSCSLGMHCVHHFDKHHRQLLCVSWFRASGAWLQLNMFTFAWLRCSSVYMRRRFDLESHCRPFTRLMNAKLVSGVWVASSSRFFGVNNICVGWQSRCSSGAQTAAWCVYVRQTVNRSANSNLLCQMQLALVIIFIPLQNRNSH